MQRDTQPRRRIQRNDEGPAMYRESTSQPRSRQSEELSRGSHMYPPTDGSNRNDHAQHEVVSGGIHYCDDQYDDQELRNDYYFDEDKASRQWDYLSVRRALSRMKMSSETAVSSHRSPAVNQSRFIGLPRGFTIQTNLDFLVPELAKNVLSFSRLRCIQEYMIPLVLYEYSFLAMGRNGSGRTCGYLIPLMHKLVEHKEIEMPGRCGPAALIVTCSQEKLKHVNHLRNKYSHGTRLQWCIVTKEKPDDEVVRINFEKVDIFCAPARTMVETIKQFQISLEFVRFIVLEEFECCTADSEYKENLMTLKEQLSTYEVVPVCFFMSKLVHVESMFDIEFMKEMAKTKVVKLILSSSSDGILISVLRCCSVMDRFRWITSLIGGEDVTPRRTVVIANAPERVHYLAYLLTFYGVNNVHITRDDNLLAVENAVRLWRMEECCVFIADYDSLDDLDYGYVETCILYELPDYFPSYERRLLDLSAKLSYGRSLHIMMNVELDRAQAGSVLKFLTDHNQVVPDYLVNMLDRHDGSSSAESKISQER